MDKSGSTKDMLRLLKNAGFPNAYVRSLLPSWWDDSAAESPAGLAEFKLTLARNLGVELSSLSADAPEVRFSMPHVRKFKRTVRSSEEELTPATAIALAAARTASAACPTPYSGFPPAKALRDEIAATGAKYTSFRALLKSSWEHGVPVLALSHYPTNMPKMDGLSVRIGERPVVVISYQSAYSAWMSFILGHEIGHIALEHLRKDEVLVDDTLESSDRGDQDDPEELSANEYALTLLGDDLDATNIFRGIGEPGELARRAMDMQRMHGVDAGHLLLRYAYLTDSWRAAMAALTALDRDQRALNDIRQAMNYYLEPTQVDDDSFAALRTLCGLHNAAA